MNEFIDSFVQAPDGSWTCVRACSQMTSRGLLRIEAGARCTRGRLVNGVDVVSLLDHRHAFANGD